MENQIIANCQNGQLEDFGKLYDRYVEKIYQFIFFKTHHKQTAEDLTSNTFMKALKGIQGFDSKKASFKTWLYQIARNTVIDHYRSAKQHQDLEDAWDLKSDSNPKQEADTQIQIDSVKKYLKKLKPQQRDIILLRVWGDHSFKEIAEITGKTEAACKMSFKRSLEKLKDDVTPLLILLLLLK